MKRTAFLAVIAILPLLGCAGITGPVAPKQAAAAAPAPPPPDPKTQMTALETRIMALTEEQRLKMDPKAKSLTCADGFTWPAYTEAGDDAARFEATPKLVKSKTLPNGPPPGAPRGSMAPN